MVRVKLELGLLRGWGNFTYSSRISLFVGPSTFRIHFDENGRSVLNRPYTFAWPSTSIHGPSTLDLTQFFHSYHGDPICRGDSMILAFLCDIERVFFRVTQSRVKKLGSPGTMKILRLYLKLKTPTYRYIFVVQGLLNFLARDLVTLNYSPSISYSTRPLAAGPAGPTQIN